MGRRERGDERKGDKAAFLPYVCPYMFPYVSCVLIYIYIYIYIEEREKGKREGFPALYVSCVLMRVLICDARRHSCLDVSLYVS